jgi:hypothetical protein
MSELDDRTSAMNASAMQEYESCVNGSMQNSATYMARYYAAKVILFCAGLWALYVHEIFWTVLLLALAAYCSNETSDASQEYRIMNRQRLLATFIDKRLKSMEATLKDIREGK